MNLSLQQCHRGFIALIAVAAVFSAPANADVVQVQIIPGLEDYIEGDVSVQRDTVALIVPKIGRLIFEKDQVREIYRTGDPKLTLIRELNTAERNREVNKLWDITFKAICRGYVEEAYKYAGIILQLDPNHYGAKRMKEMYFLIEQEIPDDSELENFLREQVPKSNMEISRSKHYMLLSDTKKKPGERTSRGQQRLELLEKVHTIFLQFFYCQGVNIYPPKKLMPVVLFDQESDFKAYAASMSEELELASGFWDMKTNIGFFYNHSTSKQAKAYAEFLRELDTIIDAAKRARAPERGDIVRRRAQIEAMSILESESSDLSVVSHEGAHQMAGSTGLLPRDVRIPVWVHEGVATYFEAARGTAWAGIGSVSEERLMMYRAIDSSPLKPLLSNMDFIIGDHVFSLANHPILVLNAYGQSWALTHFLYNKHFREFMQFYKALGELPHDMLIDADITTELFNRSFPADKRKDLDREWRLYMKNLKTELEIVAGE